MLFFYYYFSFFFILLSSVAIRIEFEVFILFYRILFLFQWLLTLCILKTRPDHYWPNENERNKCLISDDALLADYIQREQDYVIVIVTRMETILDLIYSSLSFQYIA